MENRNEPPHSHSGDTPVKDKARRAPSQRRDATGPDGQLKDLVDISILQQLQDWFAATTGISVALRDPEGQLLTTPSSRNRYCAIINATDAGYRRCCASNARAARTAADNGRPVKYVCHAGLTQIAAPISVAGECMATLVLGDRPEKPVGRKQISRLAAAIGADVQQLLSAADELIPWSDDTMERGAGFLHSLAHAITDICYQGYLLRKRLGELAGLYKTTRLLTSTLDLDKILRLMAKQATIQIGMRGCSIRLLDRRGRELQILSFYNLSRRYINKGPVLLGRSVIDKAAMAGKVVRIRDMTDDPRVLYPREAAQEGLRSGLVIGLFARGRAIGTLHLYASEMRDFTNDEIRLLRSLANQAAVAIENARLYKDSLAKQALDRELAVAGEIQNQLIPDRAPETPGFDIEGVSTPSQFVGGDFYDFIPLDRGHLGVVIADVVGKGVPGALLMATARAALRAQAEHILRPNRVLRRLDRVLHRDTAIEHFVTLFYGILDTANSTFRYANAGHNPPFRLRDRRAAFLRRSGIVLGVTGESVYQNGHAGLQRGDVLVLYTDGITEARDLRGRLFGERRLVDVVRRSAAGTAAEIIGAVRDQVREFSKGVTQRDDQTLVVIKKV